MTAKGIKYFPYRPRPYQEEVIEAVERVASEGGFFCLQAPTGFGKTPVVLSATIPPLLEGRNLIWAVRTGNETDRPVEELKVIVRKKGLNLFGLSFRGKKDMCLLARDKGVRGYEAVTTFCRLNRKECPYYRRLNEGHTPMPSEPMTFTEVLALAESLGVCPYFLQLNLLLWASMVSLSYNYILSDLGWVIRRILPFKGSILVVDEAHNIISAAMDLNSKSITVRTVERAINEAIKFERKELVEKLKKLMEFMKENAINVDGTFDFRKMMLYSGIEESDLLKLNRLAQAVYKDQMKRGKEPRSYANSIYEFLKVAREKEGVDGIAYVYSKEDTIKYEVWDMRSAEILRDIWKNFHAVIFMSGTLEPVEGFAETIGVESCESLVVPHIADPEKVSTYLIRGVSTKGENLTDKMIRRYLRTIDEFLKIRGNVAIFTASYRVQSELIDGIRELAGKRGKIVFEERRDMSGDAARRMLEEFKKLPKEGKEGVLVAPAGGRFSEGADFPGDELVAAYMLGIPFDRLTTKTVLYVEYYQRLYGVRKGRYLAYVVPALRRAAQSLGRVIRSSEDRGIFVLGDERYSRVSYFKLLPGFIGENLQIVRWDDFQCRPAYC